MTASEDDVLLQLARTVVGISTRADQLGTLSVVRLRALTVLRHSGVANLDRPAEGMGIAVSTASRLADRLVTAGLVDRQRSSRSRREVALAVTDRGADVLQRYDGLRLGELRRLLDGPAPGRRAGVLDAPADFAATGGRARVVVP